VVLPHRTLYVLALVEKPGAHAVLPACEASNSVLMAQEADKQNLLVFQVLRGVRQIEMTG
jgi:hypothetical protein